MPRADDFSQETKRTLAKRVRFRCSFPGCEVITTGPSSESDAAVSNTGMACHIAAASSGPGARRYDKSMTSKDRQSPENGIWMCYTHGKLIDTDESRFTTATLQHWKRFAEMRAEIEQATGRPLRNPHLYFSKIGLTEAEYVISPTDHENEVIGNALLASCVPLVWGEDLHHAVRDLLIEIVRNALQHGGATKCSVEITPHAITVEDNGAEFNPWTLSQSAANSGGTVAVKHVSETFRHLLFTTSERSCGINRTVISLITPSSLHELMTISPCCVEINKQQFQEIKNGVLPVGSEPHELERCFVLYLVLPPFVSISDVIVLGKVQEDLSLGGRRVTFIGSNISQLATRMLLERFPNSAFINLP